MTNAAGIQYYNCESKNRRLLSFAAALPLYTALIIALSELFAAPFFLPAYLAGMLPIALGAYCKKGAMLIIPAAAGALLFAFPVVRDGALLLVNRLYAASEAVNAYAYDYLDVSPKDEALAVRAAVAALCLMLGGFCAAAARRRCLLLVMFVGVSALETFFGVTPAAWKNLFLFATLAFQLVRLPLDCRKAAFILALPASIFLLVSLIAPQSFSSIEDYSEHLRDIIEPASGLSQHYSPPEKETVLTHEESRRHEEEARTDAALDQPQMAYRRQTEFEREISLPHRVDYLRIALMLLAVIMLLLVPFLPFLVINRARRRAAETLASFNSPDNAASICAAFSHLMLWLRLGGMETDNRPYGNCRDAAAAILPEDYAARYADAVLIWQEAAYSEHGMTRAQSEAVRALLRDTSKLIYCRAKPWVKFRIKYIDCLCEG